MNICVRKRVSRLQVLRLFSALALVAATGLSSSAALAADNPPGALNEQVKVDQTGAFSFIVPIEVPPGAHGMQPNLSLTYNSQQSSGIAGLGWSLTGLPTIERTKRTLAIEGVDGAIAYDGNDRFAYQGRRLLVTSGQYGADQSVYRPEGESGLLVTAHGAAGAGPQHFTAQFKDGSSLEFGNTADSRILASSRPDVRSWSIDRITGANGDTMTITYTTDPLSSGTSDYRGYPVQIAYAQEGSQQANLFVRFRYQANPEMRRIFIGGSEVLLTGRLSDIQTFVGAALVSDYRLTYDSSLATGRSRLLTVTRYPLSSSTAGPLDQTSFSYTDGALAFTGKRTWLANAFSKVQGWDGRSNPFTLADVNGDGLLDIVGFKNGVQVALGAPDRFQGPTQWIDDFSSQQGWTANNRRFAPDLNDGPAGIVGISSRGVITATSNGSSFTMSTSPLAWFSPSQGLTPDMPVMLADVNGDKVMDIVGVKNGTVYVALGRGDGTFNSQVVWLEKFGQPGSEYLAADLNGDGNADLMVIGSDHAIRVALSTGVSFETATWRNQGYRSLCGPQPVTARTQIIIADVNGDGLADVVAFCDAVYVTLSNGQGFAPAEVWNRTFAGGSWSVSNLRMLADLNGDGMADLVGVTINGVIAAPSNGHAFLDGKWDPASLPWGLTGGGSAPITTRLMVDVNGDGLTDMVGIGDNNVYVGLSGGPAPDLMIGARASGASYAIEYAPPSDPSVSTEIRAEARRGGFHQVVKTLTVRENPAVRGATAEH